MQPSEQFKGNTIRFGRTLVFYGNNSHLSIAAEPDADFDKKNTRKDI